MTKASEDSLGATCPPQLRELLRAFDWSYDKTAEATGLSSSYVANLARGQKGQRKAGPRALQQIERAFNELNAGAAHDPAAAPEFVPWDFKMRAIVLPKTKNRGKRTIKGVPSMLADLIEKHETNFAAAGRAVGVAGSTIQVWAEEGPKKFDEKRQRMIFAGLHGTVPTGLNGAGDEPDHYALGLAVVQLQAKHFDRINDVADLLNGRLVFKMNTTAGWLLIYRLKGEDELKKFKRIAMRDAAKIVCP